MIRYSLKCRQGHVFDSWFASAGAFDALQASGHLACAECGETQVEKAIMAPALRPDLSAPVTEREKALAALRERIEKTSEYVGMNFVTEARRMHEGDAPERAIHGVARLEDAKKLVEDGVPVAPLPFLPRDRTN
ncbi:DUF1178 family protein [Falsirhodobacter algicola]|uniref:DUF1178 family protein n=1 Tax=Falsirhodobacter algicola TaxID=2692330 RepID=A0A8J8MQZ7_9RHOB|nr:DUF1178 family protein [Falsirhodobacter algicola]QUS34914.1 DUF1178 family protein [Falsirhodobacter algicola]